MRITEKQLGEFFPRDMRFTHYVAKRYGYNFKDDAAVEKANSLAMEEVLKIYNEGKEFDSKEHLYGFVMMTFKFAILNSFSTRRGNDRLKIYNESQLVYGEGDDEYNMFLSTAVEEDEHYDDTVESTINLLKKVLTPIEFDIFDMKYNKNYSRAEIIERTGLTWFVIDQKRKSIKKKYNQIKEKIDEDGLYKRKAAEEQRQAKAIAIANRKAYQELRREARRKRLEEEKRQAHRRSEAMSWLNLEPQV